MKLSDFDYDLPPEFIAQAPLEQRDLSKLLVYNRATGKTEIRRFCDIVEYLHAGDVIVINNTRVIPARLFGVKKGTGAKIELLLLKKLSLDTYSTLIKPLKRVQIGTEIIFNDALACELMDKNEEEGTAAVRFALTADTHSSSGRMKTIEELLEETGTVPLPHYITCELKKSESERYQTVYNSRKGSVAAPTAGLHWTPELMERARAKGVVFCEVTLHVGLGTFRPVKCDRIQDHRMHTESYEISAASAEKINRAKAEGRRVICVGTTSLRTLEGSAVCAFPLKPGIGETDIFIYPPYSFKIADSLITNFHLPKSTLLMLVSAFAGRGKILELYETAKKNSFRFFSFGDAMFII